MPTAWLQFRGHQCFVPRKVRFQYKKLSNNQCDINYTCCKKLFLKDYLKKFFYLILKKILSYSSKLKYPYYFNIYIMDFEIS